MRWSDSGTKNFSRAASDSSWRSLGRKKTFGTESMETIVSTSSLQPYSSDAVINSFANDGSMGNGVMRRPSGVKSPRLSRAPRDHNSNNEVDIVSCGGGSMKSKSKRSLTPNDFNNSTVLAKLVRWISGIVWI